MKVEYDIEDTKLQSFTDEAKSKLVEHTKEYAMTIINESEKIESALREHGVVPEITGNIVFQAVRSTKNRPRKKYKWALSLLKIFSELLLFLAGCLFNQDNFAKDTTQFYWFCAIFFVATILTVALHFKEGE